MEGSYIEFEYNGLKYQTISSNVKKENGSKAKETSSRKSLNNKFQYIVNSEEDKQQVKTSGNIFAKYGEVKNNSSTLNVNDVKGCEVKANTNNVVKLDEEYNSLNGKTTEIKNINLGLFVREQADFNLEKQLHDVQISGNGYNYTYTRKKSENNENRYISTIATTQNGKKVKAYSVPINKSDINVDDKDLKIYVTFAISLGNTSSYNGKINSIVDYYDNRCEIDTIGRKINEKNEITDKIESYSCKDGKLNIDTNVEVKSKKSKVIFVRYVLTNKDNQLYNLIKEEKDLNNLTNQLLYNYTEIFSYTVLDSNGDYIVAFDKNSVPGNIKIDNKNTFEDDTDSTLPVVFVKK